MITILPVATPRSDCRWYMYRPGATSVLSRDRRFHRSSDAMGEDEGSWLSVVTSSPATLKMRTVAWEGMFVNFTIRSRTAVSCGLLTTYGLGTTRILLRSSGTVAALAWGSAVSTLRPEVREFWSGRMPSRSSSPGPYATTAYRYENPFTTSVSTNR